MEVDTMAHKEVDHHDDNGSWDGGSQPFKVSYGKLMMWYFLLSDAFTFAGFLICVSGYSASGILNRYMWSIYVHIYIYIYIYIQQECIL